MANMSQVYISSGKKFIWKAIVVSHLIEEEDKCTTCGGSGHKSRFDMMWDDDCSDSKCPNCNAGRVPWHGPMFLDNEVQAYMQKKLDEYIENKIKFARENPPFIGLGI